MSNNTTQPKIIQSIHPTGNGGPLGPEYMVKFTDGSPGFTNHEELFMIADRIHDGEPYVYGAASKRFESFDPQTTIGMAFN